jgi:hypothetical protein
MRLYSVLAACSCVSLAIAQPASLKTPELGFAWDGRSQQIRPIHGIPGAAILGEGSAITEFASATIAPRHDLALVVSAADGKVQAMRLASGDMLAIPGLAADPSRLVFSPSGTAALAVGSKLQLLTGLPNSPAVQDLAIPADSNATTAVAVNDDAQFVLFSTWLLAPGAAPVPLSVPSPIAVSAFLPGSRDAVAIGSDGAIYRILNSNFPGEVRQVFAADERTADPVAVRVSADGSRLYSANRLGTLAVIDLAAASLETVQCGCSPNAIEPMTSSDLYRITEISDRPVMLFDVSTPTPRIWFVPADARLADSKRSAR